MNFALLFELFITFFKVGLFTFGGGYAMIPMITDEVVSKGWATAGLLTDFIAIAESTPGTFAINTATFIGMELHGIIGAIFATLGVMMPSFIIILIIAKFFGKFSDNKYVKAFLWGVRPVVVGLIVSATYAIARSHIITSELFSNVKEFIYVIDWKGIVIFAAVFAISRAKKMHPIWLILIAGAIGALFYGVF